MELRTIVCYVAIEESGSRRDAERAGDLSRDQNRRAIGSLALNERFEVLEFEDYFLAPRVGEICSAATFWGLRKAIRVLKPGDYFLTSTWDSIAPDPITTSIALASIASTGAALKRVDAGVIRSIQIDLEVTSEEYCSLLRAKAEEERRADTLELLLNQSRSSAKSEDPKPVVTPSGNSLREMLIAKLSIAMGAGISLRQIASKSNVSQSQISRFLSNERDLTLKSAQSLFEALAGLD